MHNPIEKLALDHWYKVIIASGLTVFLLTGAGVLKEFPTTPTAALSLGAFFFGLGEWRNHPIQMGFVQPGRGLPSGITTSYPRSACPSGLLLDLVGLLLIGFGLFRLAF